jgi:hypothetical protein
MACHSALEMLGPEIAASRDYRLLDPWVRINYCLGNGDLAGQAAARLKSFGYRHADYLQFMAQQNRTKGKS